MKLYIAAHSQTAAKSLKERIEEMGHVCTARWITTDEKFPQGLSAYSCDEKRELVVVDEHDVREAVDGLVLIAEPPGQLVPGGKHVETGMALAYGYSVFVIGRRENLFHWHPNVKVFEDADAFVHHLRTQASADKGQEHTTSC